MERTIGKHDDEGLFPRFIRFVTSSVLHRPGATLAFAALFAILSLGITARFLTFKTNRADLIDARSDFHQRWLSFVDRFGDDSEVVVTVEGANERQIRPVMDRLGERFESEKELFSRVLYKVDPSSLRSKALQYLTPAELEKAQSRLEMYAPILSGHWNRAGLESYCRRLADYIQLTSSQAQSEELSGALSQAQALVSSFAGFLQSPEDFRSPWPEVVPASAFPNSGNLETRYQLTPSGHMGFVLVLPRAVAKDFSGTSASLKRLKEIVDQTQAESPQVRIGITGIPILEAEEMQRSQSDMSLASIISFFGVGTILLIGFRGVRHPFLGMLLLAIGISWTMGYITITVGHLNILSVSFAAILIGLGIDYTIHYLSRYIELRHEGHSLRQALMMTSGDVGTGIITAAVTTSLAFFCATFTNFLGVAELGMIAAGGILLCAIATFTVLPGLVTLADSKLEPRQLPTPFQGNLLRGLIRRHYRLVTCLALLVVVGVGSQAFTWKDGHVESRVKYDYNLLNLQAKGLEAVELQKRIFDETNGSLLYAVSITDSAASARLLKEKFLELPTVSRVEELASYMPVYPPEETNLLVQAIHARLSSLADLPREFPQLNPLSIGQSLESLYQSLKDRPEAIARESAATLDALLNHLEQLSLQDQMKVFSGYQQAMLMALHRQFQILASISDPRPVSPKDFPESLRSRFVSDDGEWLVRVYPSTQIWDEAPLRAFVNDIRTVDAEVTGTPLQNFEAARQIQESYLKASMYALAVTLLVLLIDALSTGPMLASLISPLGALGVWWTLSRNTEVSVDPIWIVVLYVSVALLVASVFDLVSVRNTFLAMLPPVCGLFLMFGVMGLAKIPLNPANLIVLPLILGIGVDDGVLVIHGFRMQRGRYNIAPSTINAVTLTSLTSIVGFGSMMCAAHQGLVSLSIVLVVGVGSCLFVSLVLLPAILTWVSSHRTPVSDDSGLDQLEDGDASQDVEEPMVVPLQTARELSGVA